MKPQIATTIEQSRRLLACGVDPETADMSVRTIKEPYGEDMAWHIPKLLTLPYDEAKTIYGDDEITPAWSLSALISLLPNRVFNYEKRVECGLNWVKRNDDTYSAGYMGLTQKIEPVDSVKTEDKSLIEACVQMIEWLTANGYSLNKTEE